jgi:lipoprotein-anchoring transpeptidase ErfK/SrfK
MPDIAPKRTTRGLSGEARVVQNITDVISRTVQVAFALAVFVPAASGLRSSVATAAAQEPHGAKRSVTARNTRHSKARPALLPCGDILSFEVLLDRQGFSSGQIDGTIGPNFTRALKAMQAARAITISGRPDCETWRALGGDAAVPAIASYAPTDNDVNGPFEKEIPRELAKQAALPALTYRSPLEEIAERFHASPALLLRLNKGVAIEAGREIKVPAVQPFDPTVRRTHDQNADITIQVSREESALRATRADGTLVFFAPVSSGSEHDPLPAGDWKVKGVSWNPVFNYNPKLFWDAKPGDEKATIKAGPNNPVGIVWIDLNLEHYGLHGTPEPGRIGMTESHGCVRLTNWDAARVAALVKPGTPVVFR